MIVGEVSENGDVNRDAEGAMLGEGVGSDFEDEIFGALTRYFRDAFVQSEGVDGGHVAEFGAEAIDTPGDGGHQTDFIAGATEHLPGHESGGGFAVGAGDGDNGEFFSGEVVF